MAFTRKFKIDGDNKPFPTSWKMTVSTLNSDGSGRSPLTGIMAKKDIKNICSYDMTWDYLTEDQAYEIAQIKTLMKKNGYDKSTISTLLNKAQVDNDIGCLPKDIQNKIKVRTRIREYNVTDELIEECQEYIKKTISSIKAKGESIDEWNCSVDNFFCNNLCGFSCNSCEFDNNFSNGAL